MNDSNKEAQRISVDPTKCQCCLICEMRCGLRFDKSSNPQAAKLVVDPYYGCWPKIEFKEDCDHCGICARYCPTGALFFESEAA